MSSERKFFEFSKRQNSIENINEFWYFHTESLSFFFSFQQTRFFVYEKIFDLLLSEKMLENQVREDEGSREALKS